MDRVVERQNDYQGARHPAPCCARAKGEEMTTAIGWSNQLAYAVGLPNRHFYFSGLHIALAKPAA
jgi:hypothetical protein